jgi:hypothetical protein
MIGPTLALWMHFTLLCHGPTRMFPFPYSCKDTEDCREYVLALEATIQRMAIAQERETEWLQREIDKVIHLLKATP